MRPRSVALSLPAGRFQRAFSSLPALTAAPLSSSSLSANDCGAASVPWRVISTSPLAWMAVDTPIVFFATR